MHFDTVSRWLFGVLLSLSFLTSGVAIAQEKQGKPALVKGTIRDAEGVNIPNAQITVAGTTKGVEADSNGRYRFSLDAGSYTLQVNIMGFKSAQRAFELRPGQTVEWSPKLVLDLKSTDEVEVSQRRDLREQVSMYTLDAKQVKVLPSPFGDFNRILATLPGVVSNNELSSQYTVRGGSFDENLVYVNDMEIYRPFLVRSGQAEGLSFVNPDLVQKVDFSAGGWQPRYGDKLSSVLNVEYKTPEKWGGSVSLGVLNQQAHIEGSALNKRLSLVAGIRRKSASYLFGNSIFNANGGLAVRGEYLPEFVDGQAYISYDLTSRRDSSVKPKRTVLGLLLSYARNRYLVRPGTRESDFGTFNRRFRLFVAYEGQEQMNYDTWNVGLRLTHKWDEQSRSDIAISTTNTSERELFETEAGYRLCDVQTDQSQDNFNQCLFNRGVGTIYNFGRNELDAVITNVLNRNYWTLSNRSRVEAGAGLTFERIWDRLYEYRFIDSFDYVGSPTLRVDEAILNEAPTLTSMRLAAYAQHSYDLNAKTTLTYGLRMNWWSLNRQLLVSPRVQISYRPGGEQSKLTWRAAVGHYGQPAFYREMRDSLGNVNTNIRAQQSIHIVAGSDYRFKMWGREFTFTSEAYYKQLWDVIPYDVDNVRVRYWARNVATTYAAGADFRVSGEFVKGAESWFSLGLLQTREQIDGTNIGYVRRPSDQLVTLSIFFQDHLPNDPSVRIYLNTIFGSGLPTGAPQSLATRGQVNIPSYRRVDIGFSKVITTANKSTWLGRRFDTIWLGLEVLNLLGVENTLSYLWVRDIFSNQFAVPNTLSTRFLNARAMVTF